MRFHGNSKANAPSFLFQSAPLAEARRDSEGGALMMEASTMVPLPTLMPWRSRCSSTYANRALPRSFLSADGESGRMAIPRRAAAPRRSGNSSRNTRAVFLEGSPD